MPLHQLLDTNPNSDYFETTVFRTRAMKYHKEISQWPKAWNTIRKSHENITVRHKPHTLLLQWSMGVHSISRILQHRLFTIFTSHHHHQPQTPDWNLQSQKHEFTARQVIPDYTCWLTFSHSGNCRDVPLIEVSVERGSIIKHCRKKRRPITFKVNAQKKEAEEPSSKEI